MQYSPPGQHWPPQQPSDGQPTPPLPQHTQWSQQPYSPQQGLWQRDNGQQPRQDLQAYIIPPQFQLPQHTQSSAYQQPGPPPAAEKKRTGTVIRIVAVIVFIIIVGNIANYLNNLTKPVAGKHTNNQTTTILAPPGPATVGQTLTDNGIFCTLLSVKIISDDGVGHLKPGNEWVVVTVKLVNQTGQDYQYARSNFVIVGGTGNVILPDAYPSTYHGTQLKIQGTVVSGGSITGDVVLQSAKGDHKSKLLWKPSDSSNIIGYQWQLGL